MGNQLRIIKHDGTSHIVPIASIKGHHRLNSVLPPHYKARLEEIDENFEVVKVHEPGARAEAIAGQNEIARLKAENEKLRAEQKAARGNDAKALIEKIDAATTEEQVRELVGDDQRPAVMKAAQRKLKTLGA